MKGRELYFPLASIFLVVFPASAQVDKAFCPQRDENAAAAEQAVCWFQMDKADSPECKVQNDEENPCFAQTNAWCADASLDDEPVITACLLAAIRMGQLAEAKEYASYLRTPSKSKTAETCAAILKQTTIRVVTNPAGAEVIVDGLSYGTAPPEVGLVGDWWESDIKARFAADPEPVEIAVSSEQLLNVFDREECIFRDLVITGPKPKPPMLPKVEQTAAATVGAFDAKQHSVDSSGSDWLLWTSISLAAAGVASGVAATLFLLDAESDNEYFKRECTGGCYEGDIDIASMDRKYLAGNILVAVGSVCLAAALTTGTLYLRKEGNDEEKHDAGLSIDLTRMVLNGRF